MYLRGGLIKIALTIEKASLEPHEVVSQILKVLEEN